MVRTDKLGVTSIVRDLCLMPKAYDAMIKLFRADSWDLHRLLGGWRTAVLRHAELFRIKDCPVLAGDGLKRPKEGRRMPGVKKMAQESETQSKPEMLFGHMWGGIGILIGKAGSIFCLPLSLRLHDGMKETAHWKGGDPNAALSHTVRMIREGCEAARAFGRKCFLLLDRYFLTVPALRELAAQNLSGNACQVELITRAKMGTVAFMPPAFRKPGRPGRPRKKGDKVKLAGLFESKKDEFRQTEALIYDQTCNMRYYSTDLLWGQGLYRKLRFVLVSYGETRCILACTDLSLDPVSIIEGYSRRFKIEGTFRSLSQDVGAMAYRFWSKAVPRLDRFRKKADPDPLSSVTQEHERKLVLGAVRASELYALASCVALGTLQILSGNVPREDLRYQRTPSKGRVSEANVMDYLRRHLFAFLEKGRGNPIPHFILARQKLWGCGNP